jgi:hypothetical protein
MERSNDADTETRNAETDQDTNTDPSEQSSVSPLSLDLPEGSESVSEAIFSHRKMLTNPADHGLAVADEVVTLEARLEEMADVVEERTARHDTLESSLKSQERQITELKQAIDSLAEVLGTSVEWQALETESETRDES